MGFRPHALIAGATGFVGGACTREFLARGWDVTALVHRRPIDSVPAPAAGQCLHIVPAAIEDSVALQSTLTAHVDEHGAIDAVVNCAGRVTDIGRRRDFVAVNVRGTANLIACMKSLGIGRLVHVSTTDVYGMRDFRAADENTPLDRSAKNPYPLSKILAEDAVRDGLPDAAWTILRPGVVWGPGDTTILPRIVAFLRNAPCIVHFGRHRGRNRWPLVHERNVGLAAFAAATSSAARGRCFNLVDREHTSVDGYYRMLLEVFAPQKREVRSVTLPLALGRVAGAVSTGLSNSVGRDRPLWHPSLYEVQSVAYELDFRGDRCDALLASLGLSAVTREEGLRALRTWATGAHPFDRRSRPDARPVAK